MAKRERKALEPWQKQDAARLLALWKKHKPKIAQVTAASEWGIGETQGIFWQYTNGHIPLNLDVALKFARGLNCSIADFSVTLADQLDKLVLAAPRLTRRLEDDAPLSETEGAKLKRDLDALWVDLTPRAKRRLFRQARLELDKQIEEAQETIGRMQRKHQLGPGVEDEKVVEGFNRALASRIRSRAKAKA